MKGPVVSKLAVSAALFILATLTAMAQSEAKPDEATLKKHGNYDKKGLALQGYDPVAYHAEGKAVKGKPEITAQHAGGVYYFASAENRDAFVKAPEKFAPEYGGWCATALASGKKVEIDPKNFKVTGGRLFLFYKSLLADAKKDWDKDEESLTKKADENWKRMLEKQSN